MITFSDGSIDPNRLRVLENLVCLRSIPSSNALARDLIDMYFDEEQKLRPTVIAAESQPGAYGRNGRSWAAPGGQGLYFTILRRAAEGEPLSRRSDRVRALDSGRAAAGDRRGRRR